MKLFSWPLVAVVAVVWLPIFALLYTGKLVIPPDLLRAALVATGVGIAWVCGLVVRQPGWVEALASALFRSAANAPSAHVSLNLHVPAGGVPAPAPSETGGLVIPDTNPETPSAKRESFASLNERTP